MNPIKWLERYAPGFVELPEHERQAVFQFALLWSFFEARAFATRASSNAIHAVVQKWAAQGRLIPEKFQEDTTSRTTLGASRTPN